MRTRLRLAAAIPYLCLLAVAVLHLPAAAQPSTAGNSETERRKLTVMLLVDGAVRSMEKAAIDTRALYDEINGNKDRHQNKAESRGHSRAYLENALEARLRKRIETIFASTNLTDVDPGWCQQTNAEAVQRAKGFIDRNLSRNFDREFNDVRTLVVKEQEARLQTLALPNSRQEYRQVEEKSPTLHADLLQRSLRLYKEPIFSENRYVLSRKVAEIIDDAWMQFSEQRRIVDESRGGGVDDITVASIQGAMVEEIERFKATLKNPYDLFPSVAESIVPASEAIAFQKCKRWAATWPHAIARERIEREIASDNTAHRQRLLSKARMVQDFRPEIQNRLFADYLGELSSEERHRLRSLLESRPAFDGWMTTVVDGSLRYFDDARMAVARRQFQHTFPTLADGSWKLDEASIQRRYNQEPEEENRRIVQAFLSAKQVIEETDGLVQQAVRQSAGEGDAAIKDQMVIADAYRARVEGNLAMFFADITDRNLDAQATLADLVRKATAEIQASWSDTARSGAYPHLFSLVEDKIRKDMKDLIPIEGKRRRAERMPTTEKMRPAKRTARTAPGKNAGKDGGGMAAGGGGPHAGPGFGAGKGAPRDSRAVTGAYGGIDWKSTDPDAVIDFDVENGNTVTVSIRLAEADPFGFSVALIDGADGSNKAALAPHLHTVKKRFFDYLTKKVRTEKIPRLYVFARIFHSTVPYSIVYDLRESVRITAMDLGIRDRRIFWYDGVFSKTKDIPLEKIRQRSRGLVGGH